MLRIAWVGWGGPLRGPWVRCFASRGSVGRAASRPVGAMFRIAWVGWGGPLRGPWVRCFASRRTRRTTPREARRPSGAKHRTHATKRRPRDAKRRANRGMVMRRIRIVVFAIALASITTSLAAPAAAPLSQLGGMSELKGWFNAHRGRPRLILLLSPT